MKPKVIPDNYVKSTPHVAFIKSAPYVVPVENTIVTIDPEWGLLDKLLALLGGGTKPDPIPIPPPPPQEIKPDDIRAALGRNPMESWVPADKLYGACVINITVGVLKEHGVADHEYDENWFDCDDFTQVARSECKKDRRTRKMSGFDIWVGFPHQGQLYYHSMMLIFVIEDNKLQPRLVECQNYRVQTFPPDWEFWAMYG